MLFEIAMPYDAQDATDIHTNLASLFAALAQIAGDDDPTTTQYEVQVYRYRSDEERKAVRANGGEEHYVVLDLDELTSPF